MKSLQQIRNFLLDMDGTLYLGDRVLAGSREFLNALRSRGKRVLLLTNNSSRSVSGYVRKLADMDLPVAAEEIFTSTLATILHLRRKGKERLFVLATPDVEREFTDAGFVLTDQQPDDVVLCFDKTLTYEKLRTACRLILQGAGFVASHPDVVCPTEDLPIPDCGSMIQLITTATGKEPEIIGKPYQMMIDSALAKLQATAESTAMIGDRLNTDMEMGFRAGLTTILVLTGEATVRDVASAPRRPDYVVESVADLIDQI
ncbi:MAG: HAD-IIA family hydrolase [Phycisphaerae bacterium]|nr:HAD-IIA family hydrolase [Phycisphaerae bacterium]